LIFVNHARPGPLSSLCWRKKFAKRDADFSDQ